MKNRNRQTNMLFLALAVASLLVTYRGGAAASKRIYVGVYPPGIKGVMARLGLTDQSSDEEVLRLLDGRNENVSLVMYVVTYRRLTAASPRLMDVAKDSNECDAVRITAAQTLLSLGNQEWTPVIRRLVEEPNAFVTDRIRAAGLLADTGDYSYFEVVAADANNPQVFVRAEVMHSLSSFGHRDARCALAAADLLEFAAVTDPDPDVRRVSIRSLQRVIKWNPQLTDRLKKAVDGNIDAEDPGLRIEAFSIRESLMREEADRAKSQRRGKAQ